MKAFVVKNRVCKPAYSAVMFIDFNTGISKYDGLIDDAVKFGYLTEVRGGYVCKTYSDKRVTYKDLMTKPEIWETFLEEFNAKSIEAMSYSNSIARELDKIEESIEKEAGITDEATEAEA